MILPAGAFAQSSSPVNLGIKLGANYSTLIRQDRNLSADYRLGYVGGAFVRLNVNRMYIQPKYYYLPKTHLSGLVSLQIIQIRPTRCAPVPQYN
jgi:hypothetical protein